MKEKLYFSIYDELMNETKCEILTTFILTKTNKNYIIYGGEISIEKLCFL